MVLSLRPIAQLAAFMTFIVFSGAFISHWIFGPHFDATQLPQLALRALNSSLYFAAYGTGIFFLLANWNLGKTILKEYSYFIAFAILGVASIGWSLSSELAIVDSGQLVFTLLTAAGIVSGLTFRDFVRVVVWCLLFMMIMSLIYVFFIPSYGIMDAGPYSDVTGVPQGVFRHKNGFGQAAALGILVAVAGRGLVSVPVRLTLVIVSAVSLFLSSSATNLAACVVVVFAYYLWQLMNRMRYGRTFSILSLLLLSTILGIILPSLLKVVLELLGRDPTLTGRTVVWDYVWTLIAERPLLGYGISSIWQLKLGSIPELPYFAPIHAHNLFMEVTLQLGIGGLFLTVMALGQIGFRLLVAQDVTTSAYRFLFVLFLYTFVDSLAEFPIMGGNQFMFVLLLCSIGYFAFARARVPGQRSAMGQAAPQSHGVPAIPGRA
jgi:O-antigen ligase